MLTRNSSNGDGCWPIMNCLLIDSVTVSKGFKESLVNRRIAGQIRTSVGASSQWVTADSWRRYSSGA